ncbi:MAG: hypothetical protein V1839_04195 [archaeon]
MKNSGTHHKGKREVKKVKKLVIFGLALFTVVATAILMTPIAIADDPACFLYYTTDTNGPFEIPGGYNIEMYSDGGDADLQYCQNAFFACWNEGYTEYVYDSSYVNECM